jgi:CubicO group peptidase (beta-lactamase class C family)
MNTIVSFDPPPSRAIAELNPEPLEEMMALIRREKHAIDHIFIQRGDRVLFDAGFHPFRAGQPHPLYSCTKTVLGTLIGIAIDREYVESLQQPLIDFLPHAHPIQRDADRAAITLEHVTTMTTGLAVDDHGGDFRGYFEMTRHADLFGHFIGLPRTDAPGVRFRYNNSGSHALACVLQTATGSTPLEFAIDTLFGPLEIEHFAWDKNEQAGNSGWAGLSLEARDLAKLGRLFLAGGRWNGRQIISKRWIDDATQPRIAAKPHGAYGYHWWVEQDRYEAVGLFGQYMFVLPKLDAVVVVLSSLTPADFLVPKYLLSRFILPALADAPVDGTLSRTRLESITLSARTPPEDGPMIWRKREDGHCVDGIFTRSAAPAFRFVCPPRTAARKTAWRDQVGALATFEGFPLFVSVSDIPAGQTLEDAGETFAARLRRFGKAEHFEVTANRAHRLDDGSAAFRTDIVYRFEGSSLCTAVVLSCYREGKWVCLEGHTPGDPREMEAIVESLHFDL